MDSDNFIDISCHLGTEDFKLFESIINQGIDSRLTGFTESMFSFSKNGMRLYMDFHKNEMEILLRRLSDRAEYDENADCWENDLLDVVYDVEII